MGCDIHLHIEVKINGKWEHYAAPSVDRWYELFGKLAGVRDKTARPIVEPKGFPSDASVTTAFDYARWQTDAHTPSWLNEKEITKLRVWFMKQDGGSGRGYFLEEGVLKCTYLFGNLFDYEEREEWPVGLEGFRFVFWFDN